MIRAHLKNGDHVTLDARYGDTVEDMIANLTADSLTGSAVPLADAVLVLADGETVAYESVATFVSDQNDAQFMPA